MEDFILGLIGGVVGGVGTLLVAGKVAVVIVKKKLQEGIGFFDPTDIFKNLQ